MKNQKKAATLIVLFILLFAGNALAIEFVVCELKNGRFVDKFQYAIDIYAISTLDPFELGNTTLNIDFNDTALDLSVQALTNQYTEFNSINYDPMTIEPHPTEPNRLQFKITEAAAATNGDILPNTEILLATINFDIDSGIYRANNSDLSAVFAQSAVLIFGTALGAILDWSGSDSSSLICTPDISGPPDTSAVVGTLYDFKPDATDVCGAGPLTFTILNQPSWATTFEAGSGRLSGTPDSGDIGTNSGIVITVEDFYGDSEDLAAFDIQVSDSGGNSGGGGGGCFISNLLAP
jgi:hypothetical protein